MMSTPRPFPSKALMSSPPTLIARSRRPLSGVLAASVFFGVAGCTVDSFFDPSRTGSFEHTPTTIPILTRIDVIEKDDDLWGETTGVVPDDLIPSDLSYRIAPGDVVTIDIYELYRTAVWSTSTRRVDQGGFLRVPELGDVPCGGLTPQEFEDRVVEMLEAQTLSNAVVQVSLDSGTAFSYTVHGNIGTPGVFTLQRPDLKLVDVLALSGGAAPETRRIFIVRSVELTEALRPRYEQHGTGTAPPSTTVPDEPPPDVESLIEQIESGLPEINPVLLRQDGDPLVDVDDLLPVVVQPPHAVDVEDVSEPGKNEGGGAFIFVPERGTWIRLPPEGGPVDADDEKDAPRREEELVVERIVEIPYDRLTHGDSSYNIVIRPSDQIYVDPSNTGVVYIDGEINRPGSYRLTSETRLTLSRLVAVAGGLNPVAVPERVDLTRIVGEDLEATIRLDLAAIRNRTEPDLYMKPDDHVIIGTNWLATPLATFRNGFRITYGFGFLLDRNFGNDVFGAPPTNFINQ